MPEKPLNFPQSLAFAQESQILVVETLAKDIEEASKDAKWTTQTTQSDPGMPWGRFASE